MSYKDISMAFVLSKLNISANKNAFNIPCPCCLSEKPKNLLLHIDLEQNNGKGAFRCPRCESSGGPVHLYGLVKYGYSKDYIKSNKDVFWKLVDEINDGKNSNLEPSAFKAPEFVKEDVPPICVEERDRTYNALIHRLKLSDKHYNNLIERGLREQDIYNNGYVSVPKLGYTKIPNELRKEACDLLGVPGFYKKDETWTLLKTQSGFFIPAREITRSSNNRLGLIQGMQIRYDTVSSSDKRYKWFSTKDMKDGCAAETYSHFVGFPEQTIYLTEGPLKGDIIYRFLEVPVVAIPGVNCLKNLRPFLDILWKLGVRKIKTAFDMDYKSNINVQEAYINLVICLQEYGFIVERALWDENYKGFDDFLLHTYLERGGKLGTKK